MSFRTNRVAVTGRRRPCGLSRIVRDVTLPAAATTVRTAGRAAVVPHAADGFFAREPAAPLVSLARGPARRRRSAMEADGRLMKKILFATFALVSALFTASCDVTGTAPPDSVYGQGDGMNQIGQPGYGSP